LGLDANAYDALVRAAAYLLHRLSNTARPPPSTHNHSGTGYKTEAPGKKAFDDCYVPAGYASSKTATGWVATPCPADTYGSDTPIFGVRTVVCTYW